ncbi:MAG: methyltransferase [Alphaproteobacteria bacterium]|nr:MAG: methyltransferase [Alphaproteobacteria bacterium]
MITRFPASDYSDDALMGGRIRLLQPIKGERAAIDPVILAAAVDAKDGDMALEMGCGTGAAALCLAWRVPGLRVMALERQTDLAALAQENVRRNALDDRVQVIGADIRHNPFPSRQFDHVLANPPFFKAAAHSASPDAARQKAHREAEDTSCADWIGAAARALKPRGQLVLIHHPERMADILSALTAQHFGSIRLFPLWPRIDQAAVRILVTACWQGRAPLRVLPGLTLHDGVGPTYSPAVQAVLRDGQGLLVV